MASLKPAANAYLKTAAMAAGVIGDSPFFLLTYALRLLRAILWPVSTWLWRTNREKLASHGG